MRQQCSACHVSLRATTPGSFVLRCPRCGRRFAAKPATPKAPTPDGYGARGTFDRDEPPVGALFDHTSDAFPAGPHTSASMFDSTPDANAPDGGGNDAAFGDGGGFDGGGSDGDF